MSKVMKFTLIGLILTGLTVVAFGQATKESIQRALNQDWSFCVNAGGSDRCLVITGTTGDVTIGDPTVPQPTFNTFYYSGGLLGQVGVNWDSDLAPWVLENKETNNAYGNVLKLIGGGGASGEGNTASEIFEIATNNGSTVFTVFGGGGFWSEGNATVQNVLLDTSVSGVGRNNQAVSKWARADDGTSCAVECGGLGGSNECSAVTAKTVGAGIVSTTTTANAKACLCICDDY